MNKKKRNYGRERKESTADKRKMVSATFVGERIENIEKNRDLFEVDSRAIVRVLCNARI